MPVVLHRGGDADARAVEIPDCWTEWSVGRSHYIRVTRREAVALTPNPESHGQTPISS